MTNITFLFFSALIVSSSVFAKVIGNDDTLTLVAQKLTQLEKKIDDPRIVITPKSFSWPELNQFKDELMFVVAHDPAGAASRNTPIELLPTSLTTRFKNSFARFETSASHIGSLTNSEDWLTFKADIDGFIKNRTEHLYGPARSIIRSGSVTEQLKKIEIAASRILMQDQDLKTISVKVLDPYFATIGAELKELNQSVGQLQELRTPKPVVVETIFKSENYMELAMFSGIVMLFGALFSIAFQYFSKKEPKSEVTEAPPTNFNAFDYYEWLKRLEVNLKAFKAHEEFTTESHIKLKGLCDELSAARKGMNLAENQQDFYTSLDQLNASAPKLEEYFEKFDIKKNSELSRRTVKLVVQLCEAIENRQEISLTENRSKLKVSKIDSQAADFKVA